MRSNRENNNIAKINNPNILALILIIAVSCFGSADAASATFEWKDTAGEPLPFKTQEEVEDFLRTAEIVEFEEIREGSTKPHRVLLERNGVRMQACFRDVNIHKQVQKLQSGVIKYNFTDDAVYELAAYKLGKLLGLKNVPPTVFREVKGREGTLQAWVEGCIMEKDRQERNIQPPRQWTWVMQLQIMHLFDQLISNDDRNQGNILIDSDWKIWMIDHTRAFRNNKKLWNEETIKFCERSLLARLRGLDEGTLGEELGAYLTGAQIRSLLKRKELLVKHMQVLIDEMGEKKVLFRYPDAVEQVPSQDQPNPSISILANPSENCFPASALQQAQLKEDFSRVCQGCVLLKTDAPSADFTVIVGDPGFSWNASIFGKNGELLEELEWSGPLTTGLKKAVKLLHDQALEEPNSTHLQLASNM